MPNNFISICQCTASQPSDSMSETLEPEGTAQTLESRVFETHRMGKLAALSPAGVAVLGFGADEFRGRGFQA